MIVRCANCGTEFSLDDRHIKPEGAAVRCSVCGHVFRARGEGAGAGDRPWQIRTVDDDLFTAPDLATLRLWITEGRLHPDDVVSRTGRHWVRLGEMPELAEAFAAFVEVAPVVAEVPDAPVSLGKGAEGLGPPPEFGTAESSSGSHHSLEVEAVGALDDDLPVAHPRRTELLGSGKLSEDDDEEEFVAPPMGRGDVRASTQATPGVADEAMPEPVPESARRPSSMLEAVTSHVAPLKQPVPDVNRRPASRDDELRAAASTEGPSLDDDYGGTEFADFDDLRPPKRSVWPMALGLSALCGAAVLFGVPDIRNRILGTQEVQAEPQVEVSAAELDQADAALGTVNPIAIGRAEAALQARLDSAEGSEALLETMKLAQAELLAHRSVLSSIRAVLSSDEGRLQEEARSDATRAESIFDGLQLPRITDRARVRRARARLRLAQGRPPAEIEALLPENSPPELHWLVQAAPLWRDEGAPVPAGAIAGLEKVEDRSDLGELVLALAYLRAGDRDGARTAFERVADVEARGPLAVAMQGQLEPTPAPAASDEAAEDVDAKEDGEPKEAPSKGASESRRSESKKVESDDASESQPRNVDRLIEAGCEKVESGQVSAGLALLEQAQKRRPRDLDVLLCMAEGHRREGRASRAMSFYERALGRSPRLRPALAGAARTAKRLGDTAKAVSYYQRLLGIDPGNAEAKAYVAEHGKTP